MTKPEDHEIIRKAMSIIAKIAHEKQKAEDPEAYKKRMSKNGKKGSENRWRKWRYNRFKTDTL